MWFTKLVSEEIIDQVLLKQYKIDSKYVIIPFLNVLLEYID